MKNLFPLLFPIIILAFSCDKPEPGPIAINGTQQIELWKTDTVYMDLEVGDLVIGVPTNGEVSLSVSKAPEHIKTWIEKPTGMIPFKTRLGLSTSGYQSAGVFDITVTGTSKVGNTAVYTGKVNQTNYTCISDIQSTYTIDYNCGQFVEKDRNMLINNGAYGPDTLTLYIKPFGYCYAPLNCRTKRFNIPLQTSAEGYTISGSGKYTPGENIVASYEMKDPQGKPTGCTDAIYFRF